VTSWNSLTKGADALNAEGIVSARSATVLAQTLTSTRRSPNVQIALGLVCALRARENFGVVYLVCGKHRDPLPDFHVEKSTCGTSLAAGGSCKINLIFRPTETGRRTGTLTIKDFKPNAPHTVSLSGTGS
jgi:hypothetical protein